MQLERTVYNRKVLRNVQGEQRCVENAQSQKRCRLASKEGKSAMVSKVSGGPGVRSYLFSHRA